MLGNGKEVVNRSIQNDRTRPHRVALIAPEQAEVSVLGSDRVGVSLGACRSSLRVVSRRRSERVLSALPSTMHRERGANTISA